MPLADLSGRGHKNTYRISHWSIYKTMKMLYHGTARLYQIHTMLMHVHMHHNIEINLFTRNVGVAEWWRRSTCNLEAVPSCGFESYRRLIFCNDVLFRVPLSWTGSVQMKSSMTFIGGNRCIEREKDIFKNTREVKRLKECALALSFVLITN